MASSRSPVIAFAVVVLLGVAGLVAAAASLSSPRSQTFGLPPNGPAATLRPGQHLCESPVGLADDFGAIRFFPAGDGPRNPAVGVTVSDLRTGRLLGHGRLPAGTPSLTPQDVAVGHVRGGPLTGICFHDRGPGRLTLIGGVNDNRLCARSHTIAYGQKIACNVISFRLLPFTPETPTLDGRAVEKDVAAELLIGGGRSRSLLDQVPRMMRRASLFRPGFVGMWTWWALLALCVVGAPALLALALARSRRRADPQAP